MTDVTSEFFEDLGRRGHEPLLEKATGAIRFEIRNGSRTARWLVRIEKGDLTVTQKAGRAECVARGDRRVFEGIVKGELNALPAILRGMVEIEGDPELFVLFQRLFPGPQPARRKR
jgi:putative sterol carrier protein